MHAETASTIVSTTLQDGAVMTLTVHHAQGANAPCVLLLPAMGIGSSYYAVFADGLAEAGVNVVRADLRGQGASLPTAGTKTRHGFVRIVEHDLPDIVQAIRDHLEPAQLWFIGHSLGGQLGLLAEAHGRLGFDGLILIASGSAWFRGQRGWRQPRHLIMGEIFAMISRICGYWPGDRLRFGGRQPARIMIDCARQTRTGRYTMPGASSDYEIALSDLNQNILTIEIEGDRLTPPPSVAHLRSKTPRSRLTRWVHPRPSHPRMDPHYAWVRHSPELAGSVARWILEDR
ncbi:alpha/beta hydrolase family protein [Microbacterium galbinum]|uniref:alpha/beta hydrolase family protein n=1 Tax=Microbacterium galbinum TaxID=2851646 RepID=UPI001FFCD0FB|nr:alpha/beta fold hydrolase [Microbacterium galbinum]MCK2030811.1 alpha/beta fold hydrolase [Microbacterium galbinum]